MAAKRLGADQSAERIDRRLWLKSGARRPIARHGAPPVPAPGMGRGRLRHLLVVERSATLRHALVKLLDREGHAVTAMASFADALAALRAGGPGARPAWDAVVLGWPAHSEPGADALVEHLEAAEGRETPAVILAHEGHAAARSWATARPHTALILWDDYRELPAALAKLLEPAPAPAPAAAEAPVRILFVDDSPTVRAKYRRLLERHGYEAAFASSAEEALALAREGAFEIAVIDYFMPGENGDVLCRRLREDPRTAHIRPAILTGTYLDQVIRDALDAGAVECMFKNEADELFLARLAAMARTVRAHRSVERERQRLEGILNSIGEGVCGVCCEGRIAFLNPAACAILGRAAGDRGLIGASVEALVHPEGDARGARERLLAACRRGEHLRRWETVLRRRDGSPVQVECTVYPLTIRGRREGSVLAFRDIGERKRLEEELRWQATHDPVTELPNRRHLEETLARELERLRRSSERSALLYIDLDRFKYINDVAGHAAGDALLREVGRQLRARLRGADLLARIGGDEFAVLLHNVDARGMAEAAEAFRRLLADFTFLYGGRTFRIHASIGAVLLDAATPSASQALADADFACHLAKRRGRNRVCVHRAGSEEREAMRADLGWSTRLREALAGDGFVLHFQPVVPLRGGGGGECYEVLLRLRGPDGRLVPPGAFIPTAERFNMMHELDLWVVRHALCRLAALRAAGREVSFSINLSGQALALEELVAVVRGELRRLRLDPRAVTFEITETCAIADMGAAVRLVEGLRVLGCRIALDDFGSGFSSFSQLKLLPVDVIKIDGGFVRGLAHDPVDRAMVTSMNEIAHALGCRTVAEYVESPEVLALLRELGVDYAQGHYLAPPAPEPRPVTLAGTQAQRA